jgi:hypothetical protein
MRSGALLLLTASAFFLGGCDDLQHPENKRYQVPGCNPYIFGIGRLEFITLDCPRQGIKPK